MDQANIATVQNLYAAFGRGDIATILDGCVPDVDWEACGKKEDFPTFGSWKGTSKVQDFFRTVGETHDFDEFSPRDFYGDQDKVFVLGHYALTLKKNGHKASAEWVHIFTLSGGKVTSFREFTDTAAFAQAYRD